MGKGHKPSFLSPFSFQFTERGGWGDGREQEEEGVGIFFKDKRGGQKKKVIWFRVAEEEERGGGNGLFTVSLPPQVGTLFCNSKQSLYYVFFFLREVKAIGFLKNRRSFTRSAGEKWPLQLVGEQLQTGGGDSENGFVQGGGLRLIK